MASSFPHPLDGDKVDSPERDHHYSFAHRTIRRNFCEDPAESILAASLMDEDWLRFLWFEDTLPEVHQSSEKIGLMCEVITFAYLNLSMVLFTLPKPWFTTGAYFVAVALLRRFEPGTMDEFRVLTLERTLSDSSEEAAILGGRNGDGHTNYLRGQPSVAPVNT